MANNRKTPNEDDNRVVAGGYDPNESGIQRGYTAKFGTQTAANLQDRENTTGGQADAGQGASGNVANPSDTSGNIRYVGGKEGEDGQWKTRVTGGGPKRKKREAVGAFFKKKGPVGFLVGIFAGAGFGLGGLLLPGGALIHVKEAVVNKLDSMTPVTEERAMVTFAKKVKATNATCKVKVRCRYKGIKPAELERMRMQGAEVLGKDGKPIKCSDSKCVGGRTIVMQNGDRVNASDYRRAVRTNAALYRLTKQTFPRYSGWNLKESALKMRDKFRLVTDPKWGKPGDEKSTRQAVYRASSGQAETGSAEVVDNDQFEEDEDGNKKLKEGSDSIDFDDSGADIRDEAGKLQERAAAGEVIDPIPSEPAGAASMNEFKGSFSAKKGFSKAIGFLNPASMVVTLCTTYQLTNAMVLIAQTIGLANDMRYASQFISTADKFKYGEGSTEEMEKAMAILQREDTFGNAFGDAAAYQYAVYGVVPAIGVAASAAGNAVIQVLKSAIDYVNDHIPGGKAAVHIGCAIATNAATQIGLSLTTFIPGAGQLAKGITKAVQEGGEATARTIINREIKKIIEAKVKKKSKEELKEAAKNASVRFGKMAYGPLGLFLAGYLLSKYGVPYAARQISSTMLTGSEDGVLGMDTIGNGFDATNAATASETGLKPLTKAEDAVYKEFENESKARYTAYRRETSNPFDIYDPYSASNSLATVLFSFSSKLNGWGDILTAPATILSSLNPGSLMTRNALADTDQDCKSLRIYAEEKIASTPFCNARYGLQNLETDPDAIVEYLLANKQIDDDGEAIPDSDFAKFKEKCIVDTGGKRVTDIGDKENMLDKSCYKDTSPTVNVGGESLTKYNVYRLYRVDTLVSEDDPISSSSDTTGFYDATTPAKELTRSTQ